MSPLPDPRRRRRAHAPEHSHRHPAGHACTREPQPAADAACDSPACRAFDAPPAGAQTLVLRIAAMDCPTEEAAIRAALEPVDGVLALRFDLGARLLQVDAPPTLWPLVTAAIEQAGFATAPGAAAPGARERGAARRRARLRLLAALAAAAAAEAMHGFAPPDPAWSLGGMALAACAIALAGFDVLGKGLRALARARLDISALMSVAVLGAFAIGQWPEAAMVMALYALAERIEARSVERARDAIGSLLALSPPQVEVRDAAGGWRACDARSVAVGALARVRPGERFALDGRVLRGQAAVDESPITGESMPVDKGPGDDVFAGSVNRDGALEFEVTHAAADTVLARIIQAVEQAQSRRAPTQRFVDRFAAVYTPSVFAFALVVALGAPLLLGQPWAGSIYKALVLLVIACPCALVISTPVTLVSGLAAAARRGILIKGGVFLEQARRLRVVALDKTGTLTEGRPQLVAQLSLSSRLEPAAAAALARALAVRSAHPVSQALAAGLAGTDEHAVDGFGALPGRGVQGRIGGGEFVLANHRWIEERGQCSARLEALLAEHERQGRSVSLLADSQGVLALFAVADRVRPHSRDAVGQLGALGVRVLMLTGDNPTTARSVAHEVGIESVHAGLLPDDKRQLVERLAGHGGVAMVGDGINDAPALGASDIGFAMAGAGSDTAMEAADVVVMNDDLRKLAQTIRLSRRTHRVLLQNIALALGIKLVFFYLALFDHATMWMAVFADMGASLLVVFNGLRLLRGAASASAAATRASRERPREAGRAG